MIRSIVTRRGQHGGAQDSTQNIKLKNMWKAHYYKCIYAQSFAGYRRRRVCKDNLARRNSVIKACMWTPGAWRGDSEEEATVGAPLSLTRRNFIVANQFFQRRKSHLRCTAYRCCRQPVITGLARLPLVLLHRTDRLGHYIALRLR